MQVNVYRLLVILIITIQGVLSSHFRGALIMVRPYPGDNPKKVNYLFLFNLGPYSVIISFSSSLSNYYDAGGKGITIRPLFYNINSLMYRPCLNCLSFLLQTFPSLLFVIANCFSTVN